MRLCRATSRPEHLSLGAVSDLIQVQLPDGAIRTVERGTTALDIATSISPRLASAVVLARVRPLRASDGSSADPGEAGPSAAAKDSQTEEGMYGAGDGGGERLVDLSAPLTEDVALELLKENDPAALRVLRHSAAHVMATAVLELFPETKLGHGPATDNGFFYDVYRETPFTETDLAAIEQRMAQVVARDEPFVRVEETRDKGLTDYAAQGEFMKVHFIERFTKPGDGDFALQERRVYGFLPRAACAFDGAGEGVQGDVACGGLLAGR